MTEAVRRLATRLLELHSLSPPIKVESLLEHYADVRVVSSPQEWDAFSIKAPGKRAKVFFRDEVKGGRRRFSVAHELGHVIIPWHLGISIFDFDDDQDEQEGGDWRELLIAAQEKEANNFAAEVLMPTPWLCEQLESPASTPGEIFEQLRAIADAADVSGVAAVRAAAPRMSRPVGILMEHASYSLWANSPSFHLGRMDYWNDATNLTAKKLGAAQESRDMGSYRVTITVLPPVTPTLPPDEEQSTESLLRQMLREIGVDDVASASSHVNGICGSTKNQVTVKTFEAYFNALQQRLLARVIYPRFLRHHHFEKFLQKKATDLLTNPKKKPPKGAGR